LTEGGCGSNGVHGENVWSDGRHAGDGDKAPFVVERTKSGAWSPDLMESKLGSRFLFSRIFFTRTGGCFA
jgi:hypothetical protein